MYTEIRRRIDEAVNEAMKEAIGSAMKEAADDATRDVLDQFVGNILDEYMMDWYCNCITHDISQEVNKIMMQVFDEPAEEENDE